ncbi:MAG: peptidylprolyl isomerase [Phycisphaerales bacterium]
MSELLARLVRPLASVVTLAAIALGSSASFAQDNRPAAAPPATAPKTPPAVQPAPPAKPESPAKQDTPSKPAAPANADAKGEPIEFVLLKTSMGDILLELNREKAPISVANFLHYVDSGFYDNTIFHRVVKDFVVQGGGFGLDNVQKKTDPPIKNEWENGLKNTRGSLAMARTQAADSATSQFYINVNDNAPLDQPRRGAAYAVFGRVVKGMEVVDKIREVPVTTKTLTTTQGPAPMSDVPAEPVTITKASKLTAAEAKKLMGG